MGKSYDIAISLCKQDVDFAKKLVNQLNPSLSVFFYEDKQEELVTKCGPEEFSKIFKLRAKVVVIISRKEWGESFYTQIEKSAILDRLPQEGFTFLFVIPIIPGELPTWYPSTHVYIDPTRFSVEQIALFLEYKFVELGGILKQITLEDKYEYFLKTKKEKEQIVQLQLTPKAIKRGHEELRIVRDVFNEKATYLTQNIFDKIGTHLFFGDSYYAYCSLGNFILECTIFNTEDRRIVTTQNFGIYFEISHAYEGEAKVPIVKSEALRFYYTDYLVGWGTPYLFEQATNNELSVLFCGNTRSERYDLKEIRITLEIVDYWFQILLEYSTGNIQRYT